MALSTVGPRSTRSSQPPCTEAVGPDESWRLPLCAPSGRAVEEALLLEQAGEAVPHRRPA